MTTNLINFYKIAVEVVLEKENQETNKKLQPHSEWELG